MRYTERLKEAHMILPLSIPSPEVSSIQIGIFSIAFYALCLISGMIVARVWTGARLSKRGGEPGVVLDFTIWAIVLGIVGARVYHVLTHAGDYFGPGKDILEVFKIWNGGIAIFGALLGGALGVFIVSRMSGVRFWSFADALVPGMLLAQAIGRLGNWFNHELFGGPTTLPWGLEIASNNPAFPVGLPEGTLFHPTFLYEIVWNLLGIVVLLLIERKLRPRWGKFFAMYLIWYGIGRAMIESLRVDPSFVIFGMRTNVLTALLIIVLGIVIYLVQSRRHTGIETTVYLPGRRSPVQTIEEATADEELFFHVIDAQDAESQQSPEGAKL